jgi:hypothetical protein
MWWSGLAASAGARELLRASWHILDPRTFFSHKRRGFVEYVYMKKLLLSAAALSALAVGAPAAAQQYGYPSNSGYQNNGYQQNQYGYGNQQNQYGYANAMPG